MRPKKIIPCLDTRNGKLVKGIKFLNVSDVGDPIERAAEYARQGADELVLYDITASNEGRGRISLDLVRAVSEKLSVSLTVGGGISSVGDIQMIIDAGADKVSINSAAVKNPELIKKAAEVFGSDRIMLGVDAKRNKNGLFVVATNGGQKESGKSLIDWVKEAEFLGAGEICLNSVDADGVKSGYDILMLKEVCRSVSIPVIASGGCGKLEHFSEVFEKTDVAAALAASVFHFNEMTISEIKEHLLGKGIPVNK
ncbi:MAG: imidazole glycerol phosphate synthase subunit HisF [Eubacterium sp.]|nr:imidazole glycerol phosphate synthase subunit HisF [Eubacterium sp.]